MSAPYDCDVVIVGAGVAGLAAAITLRADHRHIMVLEAGTRAGGRTHTVTMPGGPAQAFDLGASWFHKAARNPLAQMAHAAGVRTRPFAPRTRLTALSGSGGDPVWAEPAEREAAEDRFNTILANASAVPDISLQAALDASGGTDPWFPTLATMEGAIIAAADFPNLGLADWRENELDDDNLWPEGGVGGFVARHIVPHAGEIQFGWAVDTIDWDAPGGGVRVAGPRGAVTAAACIVTVSTGVLRAGGIRFTTPLPAAHLQALGDLPMGLLSRIVFPLPDALRHLDEDTGIDHMVDRLGDPAMVFMARPAGADLLIGHFGGRNAWHLAAQPRKAIEDFARAELAAIFGAQARAWVAPGEAMLSDWGSNPLFAGAYSYGKPGCGNARNALAVPVGEGRLCLAGEACQRGVAGTVQAAWLSGVRAAEHVLWHP